MDSAYVYLPDDEPEEQQYGGHTFHLCPNGTTEFRPYDPAIAADEEKLEALEKGAAVQMIRWPGVDPKTVASFLVEKLGRWGVCATFGPVRNGNAVSPADADIVKAAEEQYLRGTSEWCRAVILDHHKATADEREAGLPVPDPPTVATARAWMEQYATQFAEL